jgi:hypothetical protein
MANAALRQPPYISKNPFGLNIIIAYHMVAFIIWIVLHTLSLSQYSEFASWGLPDTSACRLAGMTINNGIPLGTEIIAVAFADFIILLPLTVAATAGLINHEFYGLVSSIMVFGINVYRTLVIFWLSIMSNSLIGIEHVEIGERVFLYMNFFVSIWASWFEFKYFNKTHNMLKGGRSVAPA